MSRLATAPPDRDRATAGEIPAVVSDHVSLAFDDHVVLEDIRFSLVAGHMAFLLGASGAGKSVGLKLILGLLKPDAGAISINGERMDTDRGAADAGARRHREFIVLKDGRIFFEDPAAALRVSQDPYLRR